MRRFYLTFLSLLCFLPSGAESLKSLRDICPPGAEAMITAPYVVEGVVVSDWRSPNMDLNRNFSSAKMEMRENRRTAYVQEADGSMGIRLIFDDPSENQLERYDRVSIDLNGCTLVRTSSPDAITVRKVRARQIESVESGHGTVQKVKHVSQLTDDDIYTFVTLQDMDIIFKDGSYSNVHEEFVPYMEEYHSKVDYTAATRMDGWATLLRDGHGSNIYMLVNMMCPWRRTGKSLPKGVGTVSGVIVHTQMPRYGGDMGRYSIRPLYESDIVLQGKSPWKTHVGWIKPEGSGQSLDFETLGTVGGLFKNGQKNDRIYNDTGSSTALLWTDSGSAVHIYSGYNDLSVENKGFLSNAAIMFVGKTVDWYDWDGDKTVNSKGFYVKFSTRKLKATHLQFNFEWSAGTQDGNRCWYFPADWEVEYSLDGKTWMLLKENATDAASIILRSVPWKDRKIAGSGHDFVKKPGIDTGLGPQQRSYTLPQEALGQDDVFVRLAPATDNISRIRVDYGDPAKDGKVRRSDTERETWIRFESIQIDYK